MFKATSEEGSSNVGDASMESTVRGNSEPHVGFFNQELLLVQDLKHQCGVDA